MHLKNTTIKLPIFCSVKKNDCCIALYIKSFLFLHWEWLLLWCLVPFGLLQQGAPIKSILGMRCLFEQRHLSKHQALLGALWSWKALYKNLIVLLIHYLLQFSNFKKIWLVPPISIRSSKWPSVCWEYKIMEKIARKKI